MDQYADYDTSPIYRQRNNIADHLKRNVCLCEAPNDYKLKQHPVLHSAGACSNCHKIPVYYIYKCVKCEIEFLHDFEQNFCYKVPLCWDCNPDNVKCQGHTYCITFIPDNERVPSLIVLKEAFTIEELNSVFDF